MTLHVRDLSVHLAGSPVLVGAALEVADGEIVCLLGPSGSGKSTLLRTIAGLEPVTHGSVWWDDTDLTHLPTHRRGIGMVFQDLALFPHLDVAGNIAYGLRRHRFDRAERRARVDELLTLVGLPDAGPRHVATLSGGEQQRVALARALAPRPRVLLLDEPLAALDRDLRLRLADELRTILTGLGTAVVHVTHDREEADRMAHRIVTVDALQGR